MGRLPAALFIVDVSKENIAVKEAKKLNIPVFGLVDTNSDPEDINFVIPGNDDASKSIALIMDVVTEAVKEGLNERKSEKEKDDHSSKKEGKPQARSNSRRRGGRATGGNINKTSEARKKED